MAVFLKAVVASKCDHAAFFDFASSLVRRARNHAALGTSLAGTRLALTTTRLGPSQFLVGRLPQRLGCLAWPWRRLPPLASSSGYSSSG